jgi:uncharacterized protein YxeA
VLLSRLGERATADTSASTPRYSSPRETKSFVKEGKEEELSLRENARQRFLQVSATYTLIESWEYRKFTEGMLFTVALKNEHPH